MNRQGIIITLLAVLAFATSCKTHYKVTSIQRSRIVIDERYDAHPDAQAVAFLQPYKQVVDSIMEPVVGHSARYMSTSRPESLLSNLLADIMVWAAGQYDEKVDFGIYNMGGIRADMPKGVVTYGNILDIAPFENKIAFTTLSGTDVMQLFREMAKVGGEGVSHAVRLVISKRGDLLSAQLNGEPVDVNRDYRIATIDYLLGGTDRLTSLAKGRKVNAPKETSNNSRFVIMNYFREMEKQGREVDSQIEGRIVVKNN